MMLPKTACPDTAGAPNKNAQNRTANPTATNRFAIPPLLADPFPISLSSRVKSLKYPVPAPNASNRPVGFHALPIWLECYLGRLRPHSRRTSLGSTAKGTPTAHSSALDLRFALK